MVVRYYKEINQSFLFIDVKKTVNDIKTYEAPYVTHTNIIEVKWVRIRGYPPNNRRDNKN